MSQIINYTQENIGGPINTVTHHHHFWLAQLIGLVCSAKIQLTASTAVGSEPRSMYGRAFLPSTIATKCPFRKPALFVINNQ